MKSSRNVRIRQALRSNIPQVKGFSVSYLHAEHLVEIAVVDFARIADAQGAAAHQAWHSRWIECVRKQVQVCIPFTAASQIIGKSRNRLVGYRIEPVENNAEISRQGLSVFGFQAVLWWRQGGAKRIINKMQRKPRAISDGI